MSVHGRARGSLVVLAVALLLAGAAGVTSVAVAAGGCPNEALRQGPSAGLPDCRAYELVSPPDKNGGEVNGGVHKGAMATPEQAAEDGEAITYGSTSAFVETNPLSAVVSSQYLSTRTPSGWRTSEIVPTQQFPEAKVQLTGEGIPAFSLFQGFSENLDDGFLLAWNPQPVSYAPVGYFNPYLSEIRAGKYQLLSDVAPPIQPPGQVDLSQRGLAAVYGGMSLDGRHVIFEANDALTPEAMPGQVNLYEWSAGRPLELVSVLPDGSVDPSGVQFPIGEYSTMSFGAPSKNYEMPNVDGALSSDGKRAFWNGGSTTGDQLYMHELTGAGARTVQVSASQKSGEAGAPALYQTANRDGSFVYFTSTGELTSDATAKAGAPDLYQYDATTGKLNDLTVDHSGGEAAAVQGVLGAGEAEGDQYVYFVAHGALAPGASAGGENLYVWRSVEAAPTLVAVLGSFPTERLDFVEDLKHRTSRVSSSGRWLAFQSAVSLTGYDNTPAGGQPCPLPVREYTGEQNPYASIGGRCMEVFEYDAQTGKLTCASCNPNGLPPTASAMVPETLHLFEAMIGWQTTTVQQRYLLDDGRLYFQSEDTLLPEATNGKQNIYEYEPEGVGECAGSGSSGCLALISTGTSSADSYFADASADGRDVFFLTSQPLVAQDGDGATDVYDAREDGGFSSAVSPPCAGEACKPAVTPAPAIYGSPASATFQGAGNISMAPTAKPVSAAKTPKRKLAKKKRTKRKRKQVKAKELEAKKTARRAERGGR